jgi:hypothetical protein
MEKDNIFLIYIKSFILKALLLITLYKKTHFNKSHKISTTPSFLGALVNNVLQIQMNYT